VEVLLPDDRPGEVTAKVQSWLQAGCRRVWVVDPQTRTVTVYQLGKAAVVLGIGEQLTGEEVIPGFATPVADIFA
jgi:Uma2 family endonuclease